MNTQNKKGFKKFFYVTSLTLIFILCFTLTALAVTTSQNSPASVANAGLPAWVAWTNLDNVKDDNDSNASASITLSNFDDSTQYLQATDFGFDIPVDATIDGITVYVYRQATATAAPWVIDNAVYIVKDGSMTGKDMAKPSDSYWPDSVFATGTYGGSSNLWEETWTPADINDPDFGVAISATNWGTYPTYDPQAVNLDVDWITIAITYTEAKTDTTTVVTTSGSPSTYGNSVTFTATIDSEEATGTVQFKEGATTLGSGTVSGGIATFSTSSLPFGAHTITAVYSGDTHFNGSSDTTGVVQNITKRNLTVTANGVNKVYDGNTTATVILSSNKITGDAVTLHYTGATFANKNVGTNKNVSVTGISITGTDAGNYTLLNATTTTTADITKKSLTVKATGPSKTYGEKLKEDWYDDEDDFTVTGLVGSEEIDEVYMTPNSAAEDLDTDAGDSYRMTPSDVRGSDGFDKDNYDISYQYYTGTVTERDLTISATGPIKYYGTALVAGTSTLYFKVSGLVNNEKITSVYLTPDAAGLSASTPVGNSYKVTPSKAKGSNGFDEDNYDIEYVAYKGKVLLTLNSNYVDLAQNQWYAEGIAYVLDHNLMNGTSATTFEPYTAMSRAMLITVLWRLDGAPYLAVTNPYHDVGNSIWYTIAVKWGNAKGIIHGYSPTKFGPNDMITREQIAAILYRYAIYRGYSVSASHSLTGYIDAASISSYALTAMKWAIAEGLIEGRTSNTLAPHGTANRAEVATILMRFDEEIAD